MKKLVLTALLFLGLLIVFASIACEGDQGPQGPQGPAGEDGSDAVLTAPRDRIFSLAIFNGTLRDHNGANVISLTFDSTASSSSSVVVANKISRPPIIDGVFDGTGVWGSKSSTLALESQAFADNFINSAKVIAAYDEYNIYFLVEWSEVRSDGFEIGANNVDENWIYDADSGKFRINQAYEDKVSLMFQDSKTLLAQWQAYGCLTACHLGGGLPDNMKSASGSILIDTWEWGSVRSNGLGIALDRALNSFGFINDEGIAPIHRNMEIVQRIEGDETIIDTVPIYMDRRNTDDPNFVPSDPIWEYFVIPFDTAVVWTQSSVLPGWYALPPSAGNDLIESAGAFSNGKWTVEFSRPRITDDPYDVKF
jgi:hypothetical protein